MKFRVITQTLPLKFTAVEEIILKKSVFFRFLPFSSQRESRRGYLSKAGTVILTPPPLPLIPAVVSLLVRGKKPEDQLHFPVALGANALMTVMIIRKRHGIHTSLQLLRHSCWRMRAIFPSALTTNFSVSSIRSLPGRNEVFSFRTTSG